MNCLFNMEAVADDAAASDDGERARIRNTAKPKKPPLVNILCSLASEIFKRSTSNKTWLAGRSASGKQREAVGQKLAKGTVMTKNLCDETHVLAGVHLVQKSPDRLLVTALPRTTSNKLDNLPGGSACMDVEAPEIHTQKPCQVPDERSLPTTGLAHDHYRNLALDTQGDPDHLHEVVWAHDVAAAFCRFAKSAAQWQHHPTEPLLQGQGFRVEGG